MIKRLLFLTASLSFFISSIAQEANPRIYLGPNFGVAWQNSDVRDIAGPGAGMLLEGHLIKNEQSIFGLSLRARYLYALTQGRDLTASEGILNNDALNGNIYPNLDYASDPGYVYHNYRSNKHEMSGEMAIYLNKLRATTGLLVYGFGGLGTTVFKTKMDHETLTGGKYDYTNISEFVPDLDLNLLRDGEYDTPAEGSETATWTFTPSLGLGFGYELSPYLWLTLEHKIAYPNTDLLDGNQWNDNNTLSNNDDRYHYTGLNLNIGLGGGHHSHNDHIITNTNTNNNNNNNTQPPAPFVELISPAVVSSSNCQLNAQAKIYHINSKDNLTLSINGQVVAPTDYTYNNISEVVTVNTPMRNNEQLKIYAYNSSGSHSRIIQFECNPNNNNNNNNQTVKRPVIRLIHPSNPHTTSQSQVHINANILHASANGVQFFFNGNPTNFLLNGTNFSSNISAREGRNEFTIVASNNLYRETLTVPVYFNTANLEPSIDITQPQNTSFTGPNCNTAITAITSNLNSNDLTIKVNGRVYENYAFNNDQVSMNLDFVGNTLVEITGRNQYGSVTDEVQLTCRTPIAFPEVTIIQPRSPEYSAGSCHTTVVARTANVTADKITVLVNDQPYYDYTFLDNIISVDLDFDPGTLIRIEGRNTQGSSTDQRTLYCNPQLPEPNITIIQPSINPYNSSDCQLNLTARLENLRTDEVTVQMNGQPFYNYQINGNNLTIATGYKNGSIITISGRNASGFDEERINLTCSKPDRTPFIEIISPKDPYSSSSCKASIQATIRNLDASQIDVFLNKREILNYTLNGELLSLNVDYSFKSTLRIQGKNELGSVQDEIELICQEEVNAKPPSVKITSPIENTYSSPNCNVDIKAVVRNAVKSDLIVSLNKMEIIDYKLNGDALSLTLDNYAPGSTFKIEAKTDFGVASDQRELICNPPLPKPIITLIAPSSNRYSSSSCQINFKARIQHVVKEGISIQIGNRQFYDFNFANEIVSFSTDFKNGEIIKIIALNNQGNADELVNLSCKPIITPFPKLNITKPSRSPYTVSSPRVNIEAATSGITSKSQVSIYIDGQILNSFNFTDGQISFAVTADEHTKIEITAKNEAGEVSDEQVLIFKAPVPKPIIQITSPSSSTYSSTNCTYSVKATVKHVERTKLQVLVNNRSFSNYRLNGENLSFTIPFAEKTRLIIKGSNESGSAQDQVDFTCVAVVPKPTVVFSKPSSSPFEINSPQTNLIAKTTGIDRKNQIVVTVNGKTTSNFSFGSNLVRLPVTVVRSSTIQISVKNQSGAASATQVIQYKPILPSPIVKITSPANSTYSSTNCSYLVRANLTHVAPSGIQVYVNNKLFTNYSFNGSQLTMNINFDPRASVRITGKNASGKAEDRVDLVCRKIIPKPEVKITSPTSDPFTSTNCRYTVNAVVKNVDRNGIAVSINGRKVTNFSFSGEKFSIPVSFDPSAKLVIRASNASGSAQDELQLICKKIVPKPTVRITSPSGSPHQSSSSNINVEGRVTGVNSANKISVTVNGRTINNFSFNNSTVRFNTTLVNGSNNIVIRAENESGSAQDSKSIIYTQPLPAPTVNITTPSSSPHYSKNCNFTVRATVRNAIKNQVSVKLNGQTISNFSMSGTTVTVPVTVSKRGTVLITAFTPQGTASDSVELQCHTATR